ncbi:MAG: NAD(P)-dependent glycerol-1-phosphate dehydrogenase [Candidatus Thermoplasmatota archaeon]|nr:NAD(P)-dependent glycerol-1-phosphate dehydrogenase [Candidatus Thermoplasmatota archaeon]
MESDSFERPSVMEMPRAVMIKSDAVEEVGQLCSRYHLKGRAVIVCDRTTSEIAGRRVSSSLEGSDYDTEIIVIEGATDVSTWAVDELVEGRSNSFIIGVGGGRPIDVAKYVATRHDLDFVSVPTAASHDGIASSRASIEMDGRKKSIPARSPILVIADTRIIADSPKELLVSGCADVISNYTAVLDWKLSKRLKGEPFSEYAAALSEMTAKMILQRAGAIKPHLEESARVVVKALVSSSVSMSIAGSTRPASGSEHMFAHALDMIARKPPLHGIECGIGTIMMMYLHGGDWRQIRDALVLLGAPVTASGIGVNDEDIVEALTKAHGIRPERYTILGDGITRAAAEKVAMETGVIEGP